VSDAPNPRIESLVEEFRQLTPADQDLVLAVIARLREPVAAEGYPPDVAFMDFDE
jgi:hypothetical protein